jgi:two-component system, sensor histidine kinase LadS
MRFAVAFIIFLLVAFRASAQRTIVLNDTLNEFMFTGEYFEILEDKDQSLSIKDVTTGEFKDRFVLNTKPDAYNENFNSAYWIKFKVKNNAEPGKNFLLESYSPHTNDLQLYIQEGDKFKVKKSGQSLYFYDREYINKNLILDLPLASPEVKTFYVRVYSKNYSSFDFRIKPINYFTFYNTNEYYFLGMYYGILVIMAMYNLLIYFSVRERIYIYYVLYVLCGILTTLSDDGLGYQYIWFRFSGLNSLVGTHLAPALLLFTFILYSREFLQIKSTFPKYDRIILGITGFYFIYFIARLSNLLPDFLYFRIIYVLPFITIYYVALKCFLNGYKPARYFIIGYTFIFLSIIIIQLRANGTIEGNLFTVYSFNYGLVLEVIVLSFALGDRIKYIKKENENVLQEKNEIQQKVITQLYENEELKEKVNTALKEKNEAQEKTIEQLKINDELKDKVNRELETIVASRTRELNQMNSELEEVNAKLKEMTDRANQMSLKLDVDNWNLKKKIKESIEERMKGVEVSYEEFGNIFPNESACLIYLFKLKWEDSFQCRMCKGTEFDEEPGSFARKCTRCGYFESATSHTLFHGIKFPIHKAFYITYLSLYKKNKITLNQMSALLELRKATCCNFRKKVLFAVDLYKTNSGNNMVKSWEDIIFIDLGKYLIKN